ncbi:MAG: hypothetical protein VYE73_09190 [Acidobacteriota bacterium]|nr:hypothetical protein [Acidobacteriota bacterium]
MPKRALVGLIAALSALTLTPLAVAQESSLRLQPGADQMNLYTPEQHDLYDGHFVMSAGRIYQVGTLEDPPGWNHIGNDGSNLRQLTGSIDIDVDERANTGTFVARLDLPEGEMVIEMERFHEFNPCQDGGVAAFIYEHGDSGCGDTNWPKTVIYLAGWGWGRATLDGRPLYDEYQIHFMVTQGMRDRDSLEVRYPLVGKRTRAGAVNPAAQQLDFFIRSPEGDDRNNPTRKVFDHFFAMEVTWR